MFGPLREFSQPLQQQRDNLYFPLGLIIYEFMNKLIPSFMAFPIHLETQSMRLNIMHTHVQYHIFKNLDLFIRLEIEEGGNMPTCNLVETIHHT